MYGIEMGKANKQELPPTSTTNAGRVLTAGATEGSVSWETVSSIADNKYANAFKQTATGTIASANDVQADSKLTSLKVQGATIETLVNPLLPKSPSNIAVITGVTPTELTVCGKNLLNANSLTFNIYGLECNYDKETSTITLNGQATAGWGGRLVYFLNMPPCGDYSVLLEEISGTKGQVSNGLALEDVQDNWNAMSATIGQYDFLNKQPKSIIVYFDSGFSFTNYKIRVSLYAKQDNVTYEPYTGTTYPVTVSAPLYEGDSVDLVSGVETHGKGYIEFDGTEVWYKNDGIEGSNNKLYYTRAFNVTKNTEQNYNCSHLPIALIGNISMDGDDRLGFQFANYDWGSVVFLNFGSFIGDNTMASFKAYLASEKATGHPVTLLYELETPITAAHAPQTIHAYAPNTSAYADEGNVSMEYNVDSNFALANTGDCKLIMNTFALRPETVTFKTLYISTDKPAGDEDKLTANNGTGWVQIL